LLSLQKHIEELDTNCPSCIQGKFSTVMMARKDLCLECDAQYGCLYEEEEEVPGTPPVCLSLSSCCSSSL
jgi:uncharacterized protein (DUF983 family)